jgi:exosortase K
VAEALVGSAAARDGEDRALVGGPVTRRTEDDGERRQVLHLATVAGALAIAWWLKSFYSRATFDDLRWLLDPTVRLAQAFGSGPFELEAHTGFLARAQRFAVVPSCAGMNFMIAAFLSLAAGLAHTRRSVWGSFGLVLASAAAAFATTVLANAVRIALAIRLHASGAAFGPFTSERLHEVLGVAVYFLFLLGLFVAATRLSESGHEATR